MDTQMDTHRLKPCQCCGSQAVFSVIDDAQSNDFGGEYVVCVSCGISTPLAFSCGEDAKPRLIELWNKRVPNAQGKPTAANEPKRKRRGFMYIARRKCGKVSAMSWDDPGSEKEAAKSLAGWVRRGDTVERIEVFEGDPMPEWICRPGCADCKVPNAEVRGRP